MKCLKKVFNCRKRDPYAEVYSQAYSLSYVEDDSYLAKRRQVPSSTSNLSSEMSFLSINSQDDFAQLVASVDLLKIGTEHEEKKKKKRSKQLSQKTLDCMAMRTVTSIEGSDNGDCDIETLLESDEDSDDIGSNPAKKESFKLDPMDYHEVSKICAKSKRRSIPKTKGAPFMRVKELMMKNKHFDMIVEDPEAGENSVESTTSEESPPPVSSNKAQITKLAAQAMIRNVSSTSNPYLEGANTQSM